MALTGGSDYILAYPWRKSRQRRQCADVLARQFFRSAEII